MPLDMMPVHIIRSRRSKENIFGALHKHHLSTGVIAGGSVREVLELSGVKNGFGKQLGSDNPLNNARATVDGLRKMRTLKMAAKNRDITIEQMLSAQ